MRCCECFYYKPDSLSSGRCLRYPQEVHKSKDSFCGEFVARSELVVREEPEPEPEAKEEPKVEPEAEAKVEEPTPEAEAPKRQRGRKR